MERFGHAHNLPEAAVVAAISVMVAVFGAYYYIANVHSVICAAGNACRDDQVRTVVVNHFNRTYGRVYLTYTALLQDYFLAVNAS